MLLLIDQRYSASRSSAIAALAAVSSKGKKSRGPRLLLLEVTADAISRPATPPAADIAPSVLDFSLGLASKKYVRPDCAAMSYWVTPGNRDSVAESWWGPAGRSAYT